jgi:uncharacterized RDD family membrane protein YckC
VSTDAITTELGLRRERLFAGLCDCAIGALAFWIFLTGLEALTRSPGAGPGSGSAPAVWVVIVLAPLAYLIAFDGGPRGATPGKRLVGIRVVDEVSGAPIGYRRATLRRLVYVVGAASMGVGWLCVLWDARRQAWHDKAARSIVIRVGQSSVSTPVSLPVSAARPRRWPTALGWVVAVLVCVGGWGSVFQSAAFPSAIATHPVRTTAAVTDVYINGLGGDPGLDYRYRVSGRTYTGSGDGSLGGVTPTDMKAGDPVAIEYAANAPSESCTCDAVRDQPSSVPATALLAVLLSIPVAWLVRRRVIHRRVATAPLTLPQ